MTVQDVGGNTVTSYTDDVAIATGGNKLQPSDPRTQAAVAGVANFSGLSINEVGNYALTATSGALPSATSDSFTVNHGDPAQLAFITSPGDTPAMGTLSPTPQVGVYDNFGNLATSATVEIAVDLTPATGTLSGDASDETTDGVASFDGLSVEPPGTFPGTRSSALARPGANPHPGAHSRAVGGDGTRTLARTCRRAHPGQRAVPRAQSGAGAHAG